MADKESSVLAKSGEMALIEAGSSLALGFMLASWFESYIFSLLSNVFGSLGRGVGAAFKDYSLYLAYSLAYPTFLTENYVNV